MAPTGPDFGSSLCANRSDAIRDEAADGGGADRLRYVRDPHLVPSYLVPGIPASRRFSPKPRLKPDALGLASSAIPELTVPKTVTGRPVPTVRGVQLSARYGVVPYRGAP